MSYSENQHTSEDEINVASYYSGDSSHEFSNEKDVQPAVVLLIKNSRWEEGEKNRFLKGLKIFIIGFLFLFFVVSTSCTNSNEYTQAERAAKLFLDDHQVDVNVYRQDVWDEYDSAIKELQYFYDHGAYSDKIRKATDRANSAYKNLVVDQGQCVSVDFIRMSRYPDQYKDTPVCFGGKIVEAHASVTGNYRLLVAIDGKKDDLVVVEYYNPDGYGTRLMDGDEIKVHGVADGKYNYDADDHRYSYPLVTKSIVQLV